MRPFSKCLLCLNIRLLLSAVWRLTSGGYSFGFDPSLGQIQFHITLLFPLTTFTFIQLLYDDLWGQKYCRRTVKTGALEQEQKITSLSAVLLVDSSGVTQGCSRSPDPGYVGKIFASSYCPPGPDIFSVIYNPCLETARACICLTWAHMTRGQARWGLWKEPQQSTEA